MKRPYDRYVPADRDPQTRFGYARCATSGTIGRPASMVEQFDRLDNAPRSARLPGPLL